MLTVWGDPEGAAQLNSASLSAAQRLRHHFYLARAIWLNQALSHLTGEWLKARGFSEQGLAVAPPLLPSSGHLAESGSVPPNG